jgi:Zn-dependent protease
MNEVLVLCSTGDIEQKVILFIVLVASISIHEWAHAFAADKLGDPLPRAEGRVTLDPRAHIDPIGTVLIPLIMIFLSPGIAIIGWGKPVRISLPNPKTRRRDDLIITIAGPLSNLLIAFAATLFFALWASFLPLNQSGESLFVIIVILNCVLFVFNLLPIPPLDGSHFLKHAVNMREETYRNFARYGFLILIVLINIPQFQVFMQFMVGSSSTLFFGIYEGLVPVEPQKFN